MKLRFPLYAQVAAAFFCNILVLAAVYLCLFSSQFNFGFETLLYSPIGARVQATAFMIDRQLRVLPASEWDHVLSEFGEIYGVKFFLFDFRGRRLAGDPVQLPRQVLQRMVFRPGPFKGPGPPPPFGPFGFLNPFDHPPGRFFIHTSNPEMTWIGASIFIKQGPPEKQELHEPPGTLLAASPNLWQTRLIYDFGPLLLGCFGAFLLSSLVWWPLIYGITSSLERLTSTTRKIAEGKFETAITTRRFDEIGELAQSISVMSSKLQMFITGQRRFLGDIAHELCSPIARLQMAIAILEPSCNEEQAATLDDIREDVEQMSSLINELLAFSKAGITGRNLQLQPVDLAALLERVSSQFGLRCPPELHISPPVFCLGDELLLERAFSNILRNAQRYAPDSGPVQIRVGSENGAITVCFADNGPGVSEEAIELLGEPFYRPESSRNRNSGGVGLGLAIVKTCVETCQGTVILRNRQPHGLEVLLKLQAAPPELSVNPAVFVW